MCNFLFRCLSPALSLCFLCPIYFKFACAGCLCVNAATQNKFCDDVCITLKCPWLFDGIGGDRWMSISPIHLSSSSFFAAPCSISHKILWKHPYRNALHLNGFHLIFFHLCQPKQSAALGTIFPFPFFVSIFFYEIHYINISKCLRIQIVWLNVGNYFALGLRIQLFRYTHAEREREREDSPAREINKASSIRMRVDLCWWKMKKEIVFTKRSLLSAYVVESCVRQQMKVFFLVCWVRCPCYASDSVE